MSVSFPLRTTAAAASLPCSFAQLGMLFHSQLDRASGVYLQQFILTLREPVDAAALRSAMEDLFVRHDVLRSTFRADADGEIEVVIAASVAMPWFETDLRAHAGEAREASWSEFLRSDREAGFDFTQAPLARFHLFRFTDEEYRLVWTSHHVLLDGRSRLRLLGELSTSYAARRDGLPVPALPPLASFDDYARWVRTRDHAAVSREFWRAHLAGLPTPTPLPFATPAPATDAAASGPAWEDHFLSPAASARLGAWASSAGLTFTTLIQGAWALLLGRHNGESSVLFGATRACRHGSVPGADQMIGLLSNTVPLRLDLPEDARLLPWLRALREHWVALRAHEHCPLSLVHGWSEIPGHLPLFDSVVSCENDDPLAALRAQDTGWASRQLELVEHAPLPLCLGARAGTAWRLRLAYDPTRYHPAQIQRLLGGLETLLHAFPASADHALAALPILTAEERRQILVEWNQTEADYPRDKCVHDLFEEQAARTPHAVAVEFGEERLTYGELDTRANQLAWQLRELGVGPETIIGVYLEKSSALLVAFWGILKAGCAYLPLDPAYPNERLRFMAEEAAIRIIVSDPRISLPEWAVRFTTVFPESFVARIGEQRSGNSSPRTPDSLAYVIFTSGSTGNPKGTLLAHRGLVAMVEEQKKCFQVGPGDRVLQFASISFDASVFEIVLALCAGASLCIGTQIDILPGSDLERFIREKQITVALQRCPESMLRLRIECS